MYNKELDLIITKYKNRIKYLRNLESSKDIAIYIAALANSGGGAILIGAKDNYSYIEYKGIGKDYNIKNIIKEVGDNFINDFFRVKIANSEDNKKVLVLIEVHPTKNKIIFQNRRYIMNDALSPTILKEKIFISHSSTDFKYGQALVKLLRGLGLTREQIIFTSNDDYGVPIGTNIFEWLKQQINDGAYMIYLLSDNYYNSVACLNEMGAAWIVQNDYAVLAEPKFEFSNPKFLSGAIDPRTIGFAINNRKRIVEFKNKLIQRFELTIDEIDWNNLLDEFLSEVNA